MPPGLTFIKVPWLRTSEMLLARGAPLSSTDSRPRLQGLPDLSEAVWEVEGERPVSCFANINGSFTKISSALEMSAMTSWNRLPIM
jgi:hypothetical protein